MAKEKKKPPPPRGSPAWMATYSDLMTLVLTFFVLLFAFSTLDVNKWQALVSAFNQNAAFLPTAPWPPDEIPAAPAIDDGVAPPDDIYSPSTIWMDFYQDLLNQLAGQDISSLPGPSAGPGQSTGPGAPGGSDVQMTQDDYRILIRIQGSMLFDSGRHNLKPAAGEVLAEIMELIIPQIEMIEYISVQGNADTDPVMNSGYRDNFQASYYRADEVRLAMLRGHPEIFEGWIKVEANGENYPVYDEDDPPPNSRLETPEYKEWLKRQNSTSERKARNRRVDIVLVRDLSYKPNAPQ
ncbi:MAG: OmpA family protein [Oscillospiraceae bacterium]|jgi:chemotaxis protein MotB|nr:OmpA family protein [Oscillospiraceae bacterium]